MSRIANTSLTNTFDNWRVRTNKLAHRMNQIAINESAIFSNTVTANTSLSVLNKVGNSVILSVVTDSTAANVNIYAANTIITSNNNIRGANTLFTGHVNLSGNAALAGLNTANTTDLAAAINEINTVALAANTSATSVSGDALAFAIALG